MSQLVRYLPFLIAAAVMIFTLVDIALIERSRVKGPPKIVWALIALVPIIGTVLWFLLGRIRLSERGSGSSWQRRGPRAPDDDPEFLRKLSREQAQEERIRDLEDQLGQTDVDGPSEADGRPDGGSQIDDDKPKE